MSHQPPTPQEMEAGAGLPADGQQPGSGLASSRAYRRRLLVLQLALLMGTTFLVLRLVDFQILRWWQQRADPLVRIAAARELDPAPWGSIVDRQGAPLALDRYVYRLVVAPKTLGQEEAAAIAQVLEQIAGIPASQTLATIQANPDSVNTVLADGLPVEVGLAFLRERRRQREAGTELVSALNRVSVRSLPQRAYPQGSLASHVIGLLNLDRTPLSGLEHYYRNFLPADGNPLPPGQTVPAEVLDPDQRRYLLAVADRGLLLTLERGVQWILEDELRQAVELHQAQAGAAIAMDPHTGAILGMASWPTYDPNRYYEETRLEAFTNRTVASIYEPGSVFKVVTMAAALDAGAVSPSTVFTDTGTIVVGGRAIFNSNNRIQGALSVADALAYSNNVITVQVAQTLGLKRFYEYVGRFGFGEPTGVDLSDEEDGLVKWPGTELWSLSDLATNSFGQGISVTPLQMLRAVAVIANGGVLVRPYLVQARVAEGQALFTEPVHIRQVIRPETAAAMRRMMVHTVEVGNPRAQVPGYRVGGKSGTAELIGEGGYTEEETNVFFVGFAPAEEPKVALLVMLERPNPDIARWAADTAAPLFARMVLRLMIHMNVPPTEPE